jgi:hypothetical protein
MYRVCVYGLALHDPTGAELALVELAQALGGAFTVSELEDQLVWLSSGEPGTRELANALSTNMEALIGACLVNGWFVASEAADDAADRR